MIFLTLQSVITSLTSLKQMFVSQTWLDSTYSKKHDRESVAYIIFDNQFLQVVTNCEGNLETSKVEYLIFVYSRIKSFIINL